MKKSKRVITTFIIVAFLVIVSLAYHSIAGVYVAVGSYSTIIEEYSDEFHTWFQVGVAATPEYYDLQNTPIHAYSGWASVSLNVEGREPLSSSGSMWAKVYAYRHADGTVVRKFRRGTLVPCLQPLEMIRPILQAVLGRFINP